MTLAYTLREYASSQAEITDHHKRSEKLKRIPEQSTVAISKTNQTRNQTTNHIVIYVVRRCAYIHGEKGEYLYESKMIYKMITRDKHLLTVLRSRALQTYIPRSSSRYLPY